MNDPIMQHTHTTETWDTYKTPSLKYEVSVHYEDGELEGVHLRGGDRNHVLFTDIEEVKEILLALHAAMAAIAKKPNRKENTTNGQ